MNFKIRVINKNDKDWIKKYITREWGSNRVVNRGKIYLASELPGFIAEKDGQYLGLLTYNLENHNCEIITLNSLKAGEGIGTALIDEIKNLVKENHCQRLWLITTNNNLSAIEWYKKQGFKIKAIYKNSMEISRKLKPQIPLVDDKGVPIKDEIEMELQLK